MKPRTWLLNFSSSSSGGGLKRLVETARWFDSQSGADFIISAKAERYVSEFRSRNKFFRVDQSKIQRFFHDGAYLDKIVAQTGMPDVYFSYGMPLFAKTGKLNWLHFSNALTLTSKGMNMPWRRRIELQILGKRMRKSAWLADIVSCESEFSLGLLRSKLARDNRGARLRVLANGCNETVLQRFRNGTRFAATAMTGPYAITIGSAPYKRLKNVLSVFRRLNSMRTENKLSSLKIVGDLRTIPNSVSCDPITECLGTGLPDNLIYDLLTNAECYISASEIENSSVAVLEAMALTRQCLLSDIPSHREACQQLAFSEFTEGDINFLLVDCEANRDKMHIPGWGEIVGEMQVFANEQFHALRPV